VNKTARRNYAAGGFHCKNAGFSTKMLVLSTEMFSPPCAGDGFVLK